MNSYYGSKRGSGSYKQIINEIPARVDQIVIGFLGNCPVFEFFSGKVDIIGFERSTTVINDYWGSQEVGNGCGIRNGDFLNWLGSHKKLLSREDVFIYLDPPYLLETRKDSRPRYEYELSRADHKRLLQLVTSASAPVAISGYPSSLYNEMLGAWRLKKWPVSTRSGGAIEHLWMNYPVPEKLLTYEFLGEDKTDRQRIKRKKNRWIKNLDSMPPRERNCIISAIKQKF